MNSHGTGQGAILNASYQLVDASHPATPGSTYIQIYCTGLGAVTNQPPSGAASPASPPETTTTPEVTIGGVPATAGDSVPVAISIGGAASNTVTMAVGPPAAAQSNITPAGGVTLNNVFQPLVYSWSTPVPIQGSGWQPGETVMVSLHGPLNWPAAPPADLALGSLAADASGALSGSLTIPYDNGATGPTVRVPRPGVYQVNASGSASGAVAASATITITVATELGAGFQINWGSERGGCLGVFPGSLADYSPERVDPEWVTVWRQSPVEAYGTIVSNGSNGADQQARISYTDYPGTHYGHDANFFFTPDSPYQWLVGTHNYYANGPGIIEIEWETLNAGNTAT
jgi:hypothetical protein